jgi:hypothetical protein
MEGTTMENRNADGWNRQREITGRWKKKITEG